MRQVDETRTSGVKRKRSARLRHRKLISLLGSGRDVVDQPARSTVSGRHRSAYDTSQRQQNGIVTTDSADNREPRARKRVASILAGSSKCPHSLDQTSMEAHLIERVSNQGACAVLDLPSLARGDVDRGSSRHVQDRRSVAPEPRGQPSTSRWEPESAPPSGCPEDIAA